MAKTFSFTTPEGFTSDTSYWRPVQISLCMADKSGQIVFYGFKDAAASAAGKSALAGAVKTYVIPLALYDTYYSPAAIAGTDHVAQAYKLAMATLDVDTGTKDKDGNAIKKSFFDGAQDA